MIKPIVYIRLTDPAVTELELSVFRERMQLLLSNEYYVIVTAGELEIKIIKP
jgi:hypothetical protein